MKIIEFKNIKVKYNSINAIKGISLSIEKNKIVTLVGSNGAGKSTILKSLMGIVQVSEGEILFIGENISNKPTEEIVKAGISLCPEGRQVFPQLTVMENLHLGAYCRKYGKEVKNDIERVFSYFVILKERSRQLAGSLSGGEQQMLAIGRALMSRPKVLLLDEPSLGLAPIIINQIGNIIKEINSENITIILVEQNARMALALADYAYVIETGKIVHEGTGYQLLNDDNVRRAYLAG